MLHKTDDILSFFRSNIKKKLQAYSENKDCDDEQDYNCSRDVSRKCENCIYLKTLNIKNNEINLKTGYLKGETLVITETNSQELKLKIILENIDGYQYIVGSYMCKQKLYIIERKSYDNIENLDIHTLTDSIYKKLSYLQKYNFSHNNFTYENLFFNDMSIFIKPNRNSCLDVNGVRMFDRKKIIKPVSFLPIENFRFSYNNGFKKFFKIGKYKTSFINFKTYQNRNLYSINFDLACILSSLYIINKKINETKEWKNLWEVRDIKKIEKELDSCSNSFENIYMIIKKFYICINV